MTSLSDLEPGPLTETLRLPKGSVALSSIDTRSTPGFDGSKAEGKAATDSMAGPLSELQERLFAHGRTGGHRSVLMVVQGMDTAGKGGTMRHVAGMLDPQGVQIKAFKAPTKAELRHDFLWRIEKEVPARGTVGIFDRSHYEDVLIGKVRGLADAQEIRRRYTAINDFERRLVDDGTVVVKVMLHISPEEQKERLLARLDDPTKHWKYNPGDVDERSLWPQYQQAYEAALRRCNTVAAPWLVVPADRKWYRNWAVATVLLETLRSLDLGWPEADFDVEAERERLRKDDPLP